MKTEHLSYASESQPGWQRAFVRAVENASGRRRLLPIYDRWRRESAGKSPRMMAEMLELIGTTLQPGGTWPVELRPGQPLVVIANHPFGIGDGLALVVLAEALGRPFRMLVNKDFLKVPELREIVLPIDFSETREAVQTNLETRAAARRLLSAGTTIVVFPAGGVATAQRLFGSAEELPWKLFTARLIQQCRAGVLPVYFEGQNSRLFQIVSRVSLMLRLSLLVSEFRSFVGSSIRLRVGDVVRFDQLEHRDDRRRLTDELYALVHQLAEENIGKTLAEIKQRPASDRIRFPWDPPRGRSHQRSRSVIPPEARL